VLKVYILYYFVELCTIKCL